MTLFFESGNISFIKLRIEIEQRLGPKKEESSFWKTIILSNIYPKPGFSNFTLTLHISDMISTTGTSTEIYGCA